MRIWKDGTTSFVGLPEALSNDRYEQLGLARFHALAGI